MCIYYSITQVLYILTTLIIEFTPQCFPELVSITELGSSSHAEKVPIALLYLRL